MIARVSHQRTPTARAGFSLVELLMVMAIIAIMAGLAFVMLGQSGQVAREAATRSGIQAINAVLEDRLRGFESVTQQMALADPDLIPKRELREFRKQVTAFAAYYNSATSPANSPRPIVIDFETSTNRGAAAEMLQKKILFKAMFPQREADMWGVDGVWDNYPSLASYGIPSVNDSPLLIRMWDYDTNDWKVGSWKQRDLAGRSASSDTSDDDLAESSELLHMVLAAGDIFGFPPASLDGIDQGLIGDTDGDGNLELLDGWGKPLQFYNWPTRLFKAAGSGSNSSPDPPTPTDYAQASILVAGLPTANASPQQRAMMNRDPQDNTNFLFRMRTQDGLFNGSFRLSYATPSNGPLVRVCPGYSTSFYHDERCYHTTLIVSAGPDGQLGMALPNATAPSHLGLVTNAADLADNLSNRQKGPQ